jgi:hypothetical protein
VNAHAIAGLLALNLFLLAVGVSVLFALRGWASWGEFFRLSGVAYLLGVAATGIVWTFELVIGISFGFPAITGTGAILALLTVPAGYRAGHRLPPVRVRLQLPRVSPLNAVFATLTIVYLEGAFRAARLAGLYEFDAWAFWVPKAKAIYYFGGFDEQFFRELINQAYPPLVPVLEAAAFHFMGSPDVVTLHLQFWFLLAGFVGAVVGLLSGRVSPLFVWPPLLLMLVAPYVGGHFYQPTADFLLDEFFAIAALLIALWVVNRRDWQLIAAGLLLAGAMLTKREGYAFAASALVAALVVTAGARRTAWPKLIAVGILAAAATVPWRVLLAIRDLGGGGPEAGGTGLISNLDRAWPSLRLALSTVFDYDLWLVLIPLALVAIIILVFAVIVFTYSTWAFPSLGISKEPALNPIVRLVGEFVLLTPALMPLLLATAWHKGPKGVMDP